MMEKFESRNPATGDVIATYPVHDEADVAAAVARARVGAQWWSQLSFTQRREHLRHWNAYLVRHVERLADVMHEEMGKPHSDAMLEAMLAIDHISWAAKNAAKVLGPRRVSSGLLMTDQSASLEYRPLGVVGVIGPWNYPVLTPIGSIGYALAAGNAVVFKPSEYTPGVGVWLADAFAQTVGHDVLQVVTGLGATGAALCTSGVNKLAFTGSTATGKKVMAACAQTLTPVVIEAGGKDSIIVDADADVAAAADAALWASMSNAGQTCIGMERAYVHERVYDDFIREIKKKAENLRAEPEGKLGPITMPSQVGVIQSHIEDAVARGAEFVVGDANAIGQRFIQPVILTDVPEDSLAVQEETFGPTLTVKKVADMDEAIELTNATRYGLGASIFSGSHGVELARRVRSGMASVNSVLAFAAVPALPFGGVGDSGFGRIHGADGLREFSYAKAITRRRMPTLLPALTFERKKTTERVMHRTITLLYGRGAEPRNTRKAKDI